MQQMTGFPLIDVHQHVIPDFYRSALARVGILGSGENPWPQWSMARTLELMDENGIAGVMISIASPGVYFGDVEFTRGLTRACNEALARMVGERPTRFGAMGFVPLPDVAAAAREVDYALDVLKLDGINLLTHTGDRYLGHPEEDDLYAALDRRRAVVFVHPVRPKALPPVDYPAGYTELVFDTTRAIANLLCTGTLAKYPNIRFIMSHMGGVTPSLLFRLSGSMTSRSCAHASRTALRLISGVYTTTSRRRPRRCRFVRCSRSRIPRAFCSARTIRSRAMRRRS